MGDAFPVRTNSYLHSHQKYLGQVPFHLQSLSAKLMLFAEQRYNIFSSRISPRTDTISGTNKLNKTRYVHLISYLPNIEKHILIPQIRLYLNSIRLIKLKEAFRFTKR